MALSRRTTGVLAVAAVAALAASGVWLRMRDQRQFLEPARLLGRFPAEDAVVADMPKGKRGEYLALREWFDTEVRERGDETYDYMAECKLYCAVDVFIGLAACLAHR